MLILLSEILNDLEIDISGLILTKLNLEKKHLEGKMTGEEGLRRLFLM